MSLARTLSSQERNAEVAATLMRTKSVEAEKEILGGKVPLFNIHTASTAVLTDLNASSAALSALAASDANSDYTADQRVVVASKVKSGVSFDIIEESTEDEDEENTASNSTDEEEFNMLKEEALIMERCEMLNNGCSDFALSEVVVSANNLKKEKKINPATFQKEDLFRTEFTGEFIHAEEQKRVHAVNKSEIPLFQRVSLVKDGDRNVYTKAFSNEGLVHNNHARTQATRDNAAYPRWQARMSEKLLDEELTIMQKYDGLLNTGCSYGDVDMLNMTPRRLV